MGKCADSLRIDCVFPLASPKSCRMDLPNLDVGKRGVGSLLGFGLYASLSV